MRTAFGQTRQQSSMILNMVNTLLDLAKIESIKFKLVEEYFDLAQAIDDACFTMQPAVDL